MKKNLPYSVAFNTLINGNVRLRLQHAALLLLFLLLMQTGLGQTNPDIPDFARFKINKEEFMARRAEAIGFRRGIEKDKPFDPAKRIAAVRQMEQQKSSRILRSNSTNAFSLLSPWTELGPNPIPNGQVATGPQLPVSGRTTSIAVHPTNPDIVYVGTAQGGLYRSLNGGTTWTPMLDNALSLAINTVAIAPSQHNTIFVGTGEAAFSGDSYFGVGIYRIDNANSATPIITGPIGGSLFAGRSVSSIVVHPTDANIIFAGSASGIGGIGGVVNNVLADRGIFRSTNALSASPTFTKLTITGLAAQTRNVVDIVMDPGNPNLVLCTIGDSFNAGEGGVYRSTDALAVSPTFVRTFTAGVGTNASRTELALNRNAGVVTVYAASGFNGGTVQRSIDGGATWTQTIDNNFCTPQCFYDIAIAVDPIDATRVYLGGAPALVFGISVNSGVTFTNNATTASGLHVDSHVIGVSPSTPSIIYFGSDGGIYKSTTSGATWVSLNNTTFRATQFMGLAVHPIDPNFTIGGTQDNGTNFYRPDGTWFRADFGDGGYSIIDQGATDNVNVNMYHTYFNASTLQGYAFSSNGVSPTEGTWAFRGCNGVAGNGIPCGGAVLFYAPIEQGPGTPNTVYYGANILYRSADRGLNHTAASQNLTNPISAIGISPQNDNVRIVGQNLGGLFGTTTGSATLTNLDVANVVPNNFVARAVIDPNNVNTAYVTLSAFGVVSVWKTTNLNDANPTWSAAASGIPLVPVNAFVVDPSNSNNLFAGTDIGVYASTDAGASWVPFGTGLPVVAVFDMAIQPVAKKLRIATHGRGLWEKFIGDPTSPVITAGTVSGTISACFGTASSSPNIQQFTVSGSNLIADILVNAPADFQVSTLAASGYGASVNLPQAGGIVASTNIYVRSAASASIGPIAGNVSLISTGATTVNVAVSGTIYPIPATPTITPGGPVTFCTGGSVILSSSSATGNQWYKDDGVITGATSQNYTALTAGVYTVKVTQDGCSSATSTGITVSINLIPATPTITASGPLSFCTGGSVTLTSSSASGNQWYLDDVLIAGATGQDYVATIAGVYTAKVTTNNCTSPASAGVTVTVNSIPVFAAPVSNTLPNVQYSDPITPVTITVTDDGPGSALTATTQFKLGAGAFGAGLPSSLSLVVASTGANTKSWTLSGIANVAPGTYTLRVTVSDGQCSNYIDLTLNVLCENASILYTGLQYVQTSSNSSTTGVLTVSATLTDAMDGNSGDITKATVQFFVTATTAGASVSGSPASSTVTLVDAGDLTIGTATAQVTLNLGSNPCATYEVLVMVNGYYCGSITVPVAMAQPNGDFVTGGGFMNATSSAGAYAADNNNGNESRINFGFNCKYNKSGKNLQGNANIIFRRNGLLYQIKSNAIQSLSVNNTTKTATFVTRANLFEIVNGIPVPVVLSSYLILRIDMIDKGEPGINSDEIGITASVNGGGMIFSSHWINGNTARKTLDGGNLVVRGGGVGTAAPTTPDITQARKAQEEVVPEVTMFDVTAVPNPSKTNFAVNVKSPDKKEEIKLLVIDVQGRVIETRTIYGDMRIELGNKYMPGTYILKFIQGKNRKELKLVKLPG